MDGHVTSEIFSAEHDKWVVVDAMYDHYMRDGDVPLSAVQVHELLARGGRPHVMALSTAAAGDESEKAEFDQTLARVYGGGVFMVYDGDLYFSTDRPNLVLRAINLSTDMMPHATSPAIRLLRLFIYLSIAASLGSAALAALSFRRAGRRKAGAAAHWIAGSGRRAKSPIPGSP
jgi:hypothetical protein